MADTRIFLTTTGAGTWTVPADCTSATIECIGGGGGGTLTQDYYGSGGGAYSKKNSLSVTPDSSVSYSIGEGGVSVSVSYPARENSGGDTWFYSTTTVLAKGGQGGGYKSVGQGGQASAGYGDVKYSGGNGYNYTSGGGGAAGPNGNGNNGGFATGGSADAGHGGEGGQNQAGNSYGKNGTEWDASHGSGGGAGHYNTNYSSRGGLYGGAAAAKYTGDAGGQGLIVITYTPVVAATGAFFQLF